MFLVTNPSSPAAPMSDTYVLLLLLLLLLLLFLSGSSTEVRARRALPTSTASALVRPP
jgi:hypothetical protein